VAQYATKSLRAPPRGATLFRPKSPVSEPEWQGDELADGLPFGAGATTEEGAYDDLARTTSIGSNRYSPVGSPSGPSTGFARMQRSMTSFRTPISQSTETLVFSMPGWVWGRDYPFEAD